MDPFHVVRLAGDALDRCRRRVQQNLHGHRTVARPQGRPPLRPADPHTGADLFIDKQHQSLTAVFGVEEHDQVEATWGIYQLMITTYRHPDRPQGRRQITALIDTPQQRCPSRTHRADHAGGTLKKRAEDVLADIDRPGTSNGPTEAINGRLEHLRRSALGIRSLTNDIARSMLETGGFRPQLHPRS